MIIVDSIENPWVVHENDLGNGYGYGYGYVCVGCWTWTSKLLNQLDAPAPSQKVKTR